MMGASALVMGAMFTACSNDEGVTAEEYYQALYNQAFEKAFGKVSPNQDWGFGPSGSTRATRANPGTDVYPATHEYKDANGVVIAGANMNHNEWADPNKEYGGWLVPDPLTEGQRLRVQKYFQANPNLAYEDPHYRHFFVQQVYTGGTDKPTTGNHEQTAAANGQVHAGSTLNQLTVGEACSHINDFNAGTCTASNVLDNGKTVNNATYHSDQITLMVNVYDTSCFGYHETGGSNVKGVINHNDKMALVSAATIDAWAEANGKPGEPVVDDWNRSFMGFDYELLPESDIIPENPTYAKITDVPNYNNIPYAWDGTNVMTIGEKPAPATPVSAGTEVDLTSQFSNCYNGTVTNNENGIVFVSNGYAGLQAYNTVGETKDWTAYTKFVIEFAEATTVDSKIEVKNAFTKSIPEGTTKFEVDLTGNNYTNVSEGATLMSDKAATFKISKIYLITGETAAEEDNTIYYNPTYLLGDNDADKIMFYSSENTNQYGGTIINLTEDEMKITQDGKTCLNLVKFRQLKNDGYHPISTDLKKWVKWEKACDGYYSDWIVTLTEAQRIGTTPEPDPDPDPTPGGPTKKSIRIMAEDLSANEASDFDFNDVVFDVEWTFAANETSTNKVKVTLWAAGGTLPLKINSVGGAGGFEVHNALGVSEIKTMINTHAKDRAGTYKEKDANGVVQEVTYYWLDDAKDNNPYEETITLANGASISKDDFETDVNTNLRVEVEKNGQWYLLTAERGTPACKFGCPVGTPWAMERHNMNNAFTDFKSWVNNSAPTTWYNSKVTEQVYNAGMSVICVHGQH